MSDFQQALKYFQLRDYASSILIIGVVYDYFLAFSREVEYIWLKPWTWVSTLFMLVRYLGILQALLLGIADHTSFPATATWLFHLGTVIYQVNQWLFLIYLAVVDLIMIMRIYAMWSRSKIILGFCLFIYVPITIIGFVFATISDNPNTPMSTTTEEFLNMSVCYITLNLSSPIWVYLIPSYIVSPSLFLLPLIQTCKESFDMYKATKKWQPNRYMKLLVRDGIVYFIIRSSYNIQWGINYGFDTPFNFAEPFMDLLSLMLLFSMLPRFIIGIRELYDYDAHRQCQAVDTGFGILSRFVASNNVTLPGIEFADDGGSGQIGDADMTPLTVDTSRV